MPSKGNSRSNSRKAQATQSMSKSKQPNYFPLNLQTAASILKENKLSLKLLNAIAYVDLRDVTINPYDYNTTTASPLSPSPNVRAAKPTPKKNAFPNDSDDDFDRRRISKREEPAPLQRRRRSLRAKVIETVDLVSDIEDENVEGVTQKANSNASESEEIVTVQKKTPEHVGKSNRTPQKKSPITSTFSAKKVKNVESSLINRTIRPPTPFRENIIRESKSARKVDSKTRRDSKIPVKVNDSKRKSDKIDTIVSSEDDSRKSAKGSPKRKSPRKNRIESDEDEDNAKIVEQRKSPRRKTADASSRSKKRISFNSLDSQDEGKQKPKGKRLVYSSDEISSDVEPTANTKEVNGKADDVDIETVTVASSEDSDNSNSGSSYHALPSTILKKQSPVKDKNKSKAQSEDENDEGKLDTDNAQEERDDESEAEKETMSENTVESHVPIIENENNMDVDEDEGPELIDSSEKLEEEISEKPLEDITEKVVSNGVPSTEELINILAGTEVPEAAADGALDATLNDSATSHTTDISAKSIEKLEASKKVAAESTKLIRDISAEASESPNSKDDKTIGQNSEVSKQSDDVAENMDTSVIRATPDNLNVSTNSTSSMKKKRASFKIRFSKSFEYSKHNCSLCKMVFKKKVDLEFHCLRHLDARDLYVRVYQATLPRKYDTSENDIEKYLRPRRKSRVTPIDVDEARSLVSKYCKDDSYLEPFADLIEGDISLDKTNGDELGLNVTVLSDITVTQSDKPEHIVEIDEDQLEAVVATSKSPTPVVELVEDNKEMHEDISDCEDVDCEIVKEGEENDVGDCEVIEEDKEQDVGDCEVVDKEVANENVPDSEVIDFQSTTTEVDPDTEVEELEIIPETQEVIPETQEVIPETQEVIPETQDEILELHDESDDIIPATQEEAIVVAQDIIDIDDNSEPETIVESAGDSGESKNSSDKEKDDTVIELDAEQEKVVEEDAPNEQIDLVLESHVETAPNADKTAEEETKKRKRDSVDEESDSESKKAKVDVVSDVIDKCLNTSRSSNMTEDFHSCVDVTSPKPSLLNEGEDDPVKDSEALECNSRPCRADTSPSKCSDTSENENPEYLLKLAKLDNQLQTIIDNTKETVDVYADLDSTMTEADILQGNDKSDGGEGAEDADLISTQRSVAL